MIHCAYCSKHCHPTREHIVPRWYSLTPGKSETFNARQPLTHVNGDLVIKDVCASCNGGELSALDGYGKSLYDRYFSNPVYFGNRVEVDFDVPKLKRWLLKLSFNSGRANGTDLQTLRAYRQVILGNVSCRSNMFLACHLVGVSATDEQMKIIRPAHPRDHPDDLLPPKWFRICQMRLPISPVNKLMQRQILINSFAFSIIVGGPANQRSQELLDAVSVFNQSFPSYTELVDDEKCFRMLCNSDHAAQSIDQLQTSFPNRYGFESNDYTKRLLREQTGATILALTREMIEEGDVDSATHALKAMVRNREMAFAHGMRVGIMVEGYDEDPRELWEVEEVRKYLRRLFLRCPFVMLLTHPSLSLTKLLFACWIFEPDDNGDLALSSRENEFLNRCFAGANEVAYRLFISPEVQRLAEKSAIQSLYPDFTDAEFNSIVSINRN